MTTEVALRDYQQEIFSQLSGFATQGKKNLLVRAPTGAGKTIIAAEIIKRANAKGNRVLFVTHRLVLARQSLDTFRSFGIDCGLLGGGERSDAPCVVAMLQTIGREDSDVDISGFSVILIDEVHYGWDSAMIGRVLAKANKEANDVPA